MSEPFSIGVDLGATNLRIASYAQGLGFLDKISFPTPLGSGRKHVVAKMCDAIQELARRRHDGLAFAGVGIGSPGPLELPRGILRNPPNLPGWDGFDLRAAVESRLRYPVVVESDGNIAALA